MNHVPDSMRHVRMMALRAQVGTRYVHKCLTWDVRAGRGMSVRERITPQGAIILCAETGKFSFQFHCAAADLSGRRGGACESTNFIMC